MFLGLSPGDSAAALVQAFHMQELGQVGVPVGSVKKAMGKAGSRAVNPQPYTLSPKPKSKPLNRVCGSGSPAQKGCVIL